MAGGFPSWLVISAGRFTMPDEDVTIRAVFAKYNTPSDSGSFDSDSGGDSVRIGTDYTLQLREEFHWLTRAEIDALIAKAKERGLGYILSRRGDQYGIRKDNMLYLAQQGFYLLADSTADRAVQVRVTIPEPGKAEEDFNLSGAVAGTNVEKVKKLFEK